MFLNLESLDVFSCLKFVFFAAPTLEIARNNLSKVNPNDRLFELRMPFTIYFKRFV